MSKVHHSVRGRAARLIGRLGGGFNRPARRHIAAIFSLGLSVTLATVAPASAQEFSGVLQNIVDMLTGETARLLAVLGVIIIGFLWIFGHIDLRRAAIVVAGIVVLFSAEEIVSMITG